MTDQPQAEYHLVFKKLAEFEDADEATEARALAEEAEEIRQLRAIIAEATEPDCVEFATT